MASEGLIIKFFEDIEICIDGALPFLCKREDETINTWFVDTDNKDIKIMIEHNIKDSKFGAFIKFMNEDLSKQARNDKATIDFKVTTTLRGQDSETVLFQEIERYKHTERLDYGYSDCLTPKDKNIKLTFTDYCLGVVYNTKLTGKIDKYIC